MGHFLHTFFSPLDFLRSAPVIWSGFRLNLELMFVAEAFVLVFALLIAIVRGLPGRVAAPLRWLAIAYTDIFRGTPLLLVLFMVQGFAALNYFGLSSVSLFTNGVIALVLVYTAYVTEVFRAGIESVHPSQRMAARSLGLSYMQAMRYVVLPQAIRRVVPPLLNDFIGLQKDTSLVGILGAIEAFNQSQIDTDATFNYTPYLAAALLFVAITIPLARFTDWLIARDRRRRQSGGVA